MQNEKKKKVFFFFYWACLQWLIVLAWPMWHQPGGLWCPTIWHRSKSQPAASDSVHLHCDAPDHIPAWLWCSHVPLCTRLCPPGTRTLWSTKAHLRIGHATLAGSSLHRIRAHFGPLFLGMLPIPILAQFLGLGCTTITNQPTCGLSFIFLVLEFNCLLVYIFLYIYAFVCRHYELEVHKLFSKKK